LPSQLEGEKFQALENPAQWRLFDPRFQVSGQQPLGEVEAQGQQSQLVREPVLE
jgi:hypothetical protein